MPFFLGENEKIPLEGRGELRHHLGRHLQKENFDLKKNFRFIISGFTNLKPRKRQKRKKNPFREVQGTIWELFVIELLL